MMLSYWQRQEATAEALAGGELHTGDLGFLDADGYLHVRDRKSLVIIRGGANVYPAEVERVLLEAPGVVACAVFQERWAPAAGVVTAAGELDLDDFCAQVGQRLRTPRPGQHTRQVKHTHAGQGARRRGWGGRVHAGILRHAPG